MKVFALFLSALTIVAFMGGCDEGVNMMKPVMEDHTAPEPPMEPEAKPPVDPGMVGDMKKPEEPTTPDQDLEPPAVTEVTYYTDQQLTTELTGTVEEGTTIYTKIIFSEPMQYVVSDNKNARPVISLVIESKATRFQVKPHDASEKNFKSGDCKPLGNNTDEFICKYTTQADDDGVFAIQVDSINADKSGNTLTTDYISDATLILQPTEIQEIGEPDPDDQPVRPGESALSEEEAREKAYGIARELYPLYVEARRTGRRELYEKRNTAFKEKTGLEFVPLVRALGKIQRQEDPTAKEFYAMGENSPMQMIAEYLYLFYRYPEKTEAELLELFRQAARNGATTVDREQVKLLFEEPPDPLYEEAKRISERLFHIYNDLWKKELENPSPDFSTTVSEAFVEETGIAWFTSTLVFDHLPDRYLLEHPEDKEYLEIVRTYGEQAKILVTEFLYVIFSHPEENVLWVLLDPHFREHVRNKDLFDETRIQNGEYVEEEYY